ncbi:hypothetical protein [Roseomonas sp. WA12]
MADDDKKDAGARYSPRPEVDEDITLPGQRQKYGLDFKVSDLAAGQTVALKFVEKLTQQEFSMTDFDATMLARNIKTGKWNEPVEWVASRDGVRNGAKGQWRVQLNVDDATSNSDKSLGPTSPHIGYTAEFKGSPGYYIKKKGHVVANAVEACRLGLDERKKFHTLKQTDPTEATKKFDAYHNRRR